MAKDVKKAKTDTAPKKETAKPADKKETTTPAEKTADAAPSKTEGGEKAESAPKGYSRGEGQKPVTQAYKDNWDAIFKKKKR